MGLVNTCCAETGCDGVGVTVMVGATPCAPVEVQATPSMVRASNRNKCQCFRWKSIFIKIVSLCAKSKLVKMFSICNCTIQLATIEKIEYNVIGKHSFDWMRGQNKQEEKTRT